MTDEELTTLRVYMEGIDGRLGQIDTALTAHGQKMDTLSALFHAKTAEMSEKVTEVYVLRHPQGKCAEIVELREGQDKHDVRLRTLEGNWRLLLGVMGGGLAGAGGIGALVARALGG